MCLKCALKVGYIARFSYWKLLQCLLTAVVTLVALTVNLTFHSLSGG